MTITVDAVYENGLLKPKGPVVLTEGTTVRLTITPWDEDYDPLAAVIGIADGPAEGDGAEKHDNYIHIYGLTRSSDPQP